MSAPTHDWWMFKMTRFMWLPERTFRSEEEARQGLEAFLKTLTPAEIRGWFEIRGPYCTQDEARQYDQPPLFCQHRR